MTPDEAKKKPLRRMKGGFLPLRDDPRLSPEDRHNEWVRAHVKPLCKMCGGAGRVLVVFDADRFEVLAHGAQNYTDSCPNCVLAPAPRNKVKGRGRGAVLIRTAK